MITLTLERALIANPISAAAAVVALLALSVSASAEPARSSWAPQIAIETRYFVDGTERSQATSGTVLVSPDGLNAATVMRRGDLACDCIVDELMVFTAEQLRTAVEQGQAPTNIRSINRRSNTNRAPIEALRWLPNGAVAFLSPDESGVMQAFVWRTLQSQPEQVTHAAASIFAFDVGNSSVVYLSPAETRTLPASRYPAAFLEPSDFGRAFVGPSFRPPHAVYIEREGSGARQITEPNALRSSNEALLSVSPDGNYAIGITQVDQRSVPSSWFQYASLRETNERDQGRAFFSQFRLFDLRSGISEPVVEAPIGPDVGFRGSVPAAVWYPDSRRVVIVNTALPLGVRPQSRAASFVIDLQVPSRRYDIIEEIEDPNAELRLSWRIPGVELLAEGGETARIIRRSIRAWNGASVAPRTTAEGTLATGVRLLVKEDDSVPPSLLAEFDGSEVTIVPTDPLLDGVTLARAESLRWRDPAGVEQTGILYRAAGLTEPGPVVVQASFLQRGRFRPDGPTATAYAAQSLAARRISVLQLAPAPLPDQSNAQAFVYQVDSAVDELVRQGVADRDRVGLLGFSYTGYLTLYALTHPGRTRFAAAIDADGNDHSYVQYLFWSVASPAARRVYTGTYERDNGGFFWENRERWLENTPGFNVHAITTPLLLTISGYGRAERDFVQWVEIYAGSLLNENPIELLYFPDGEHVLVRPREIVASQSATVDWMEFWLMGDNSDNNNLPARFERWRLFRQQRSDRPAP